SRRSSFDTPPVAGDEVQDRGKSLSFDPEVFSECKTVQTAPSIWSKVIHKMERPVLNWKAGFGF
ncbi:MAG: hypothetical protein KAW02_07015, partial [candidate division Zixibacteria bacterium]|nr:hypothetical protein [candidate division Zixibacteria bacterium]